MSERRKREKKEGRKKKAFATLSEFEKNGKKLPKAKKEKNVNSIAKNLEIAAANKTNEDLNKKIELLNIFLEKDFHYRGEKGDEFAKENTECLISLFIFESEGAALDTINSINTYY